MDQFYSTAYNYKVTYSEGYNHWWPEISKLYLRKDRIILTGMGTFSLNICFIQ